MRSGALYPGVSGKATAFTYDGLGRRVTIASTPPDGGSATTTSYLWCASSICQARNAGNATIRSYYDEGEFVPGTPDQPYYYGIDKIGSVRRAFASSSSAPAYSYDPYGVPLQPTAPVTDFVYGGMFANADSGLYLARRRLYDPVAGRWLSRDPLGEPTDPTANLYPYVGGNPIRFVDPDGTQMEHFPRMFCYLTGRCDSCPKPASAPGCPPGMSCMTGDQGGSSGDEGGITPRPDVAPQAGGRAGENVKNLTGPPNSAIPSVSGDRIWITNEKGEVILDIQSGRAKSVVPGQGFAGERPPTSQELELLKKVFTK
jgi:RHS repeat-associated protein